MDSIVIVFILAALLIGLGLGYFFGSRPVAEGKARHAERDSEARELDAKYLRTFADLEAARERAGRADALSEELRDTRAAHEIALEELRRTNGALSSELATLREKTANFDEQKRLLVEAREELLKEFQNTGSAVLGKAQEAFLERAAERFGHSERSSEEKIRALLQPVGDRLKKYEDQVAALEEKRVAGAIKTDFILSAEIMTIALAAIPASTFWLEAATLATVAVGITLAVYGAVALIVAGFFLTAWVGSSIPRNSGWSEAETGIPIMVESNGVHTGIVMPVVTPVKDWRETIPFAAEPLPDGRRATHISVGWGDREVYRTVATWGDLKPGTALRIATRGGPAVMRVARCQTASSRFPSIRGDSSARTAVTLGRPVRMPAEAANATGFPGSLSGTTMPPVT